MMEKKKEIQIAEKGYLKQPNNLVTMRHSFDVTQGRVVSAIIEKLQQYISTECEKGDAKSIIEQFRDSDFAEISKNNLVLTITYKEVGVNSKNYVALRQSLLEMAKIPVNVFIRDDKGNPWETFEQLCTPMIPMEMDEDGVMSELKYQHYFKIVISEKVLSFLIDTKKGWNTYLRRVIMTTKNKYAFRFYLLMSQWKNVGSCEKTVTELREWLKMEDKCARWNDFLARVIKPAEKELNALFKKGVCDLYFKYTLVYPPGKKRGEPDKVRFAIFDKDMVEAEEVKQGTALDLDNFLFKEFTLNTKDREKILSMVTDDNRADFLNFCTDYLPKAIKKNRPKTLATYAHTALVKFLTNWKPISHEVPSHPEETLLDRHAAKVAQQSFTQDESGEMWQRVLAVCREQWGEALCQQWLEPLKYQGRRDGKVYIKLPTSQFGREMYQNGYYDKVLVVCRELWPKETFAIE